MMTFAATAASFIPIDQAAWCVNFPNGRCLSPPTAYSLLTHCRSLLTHCPQPTCPQPAKAHPPQLTAR